MCLCRASSSPYYLIPVLPVRKTVLFPEHGSIFTAISLEMSSQNTAEWNPQEFRFVFPPCLRSALPGKEGAGAYVNNDKKVIEL